MTIGDRDGYSLIEVTVALVILGITMLGMQAVVTDRLVAAVAREDRVAVANQLAKDRIAEVELDPSYLTLEARFNGTESMLPGNQDFSRSTLIVRNGTPAVDGDYKTVTVRVWAKLMTDTISRTTIVAAP